MPKNVQREREGTPNELDNVAHYAPLRHLANILCDAQLLLCTVTGLADPREASLDWIDIIGYSDKVNPADWQAAQNLKNGIGKRLRILCTASPYEDTSPGRCKIETALFGRPRMWAQYASNSTGFCVVLKKEVLDGEIRKLASLPDHIISDHVDYVVGQRQLPSILS